MSDIVGNSEDGCSRDLVLLKTALPDSVINFVHQLYIFFFA